MVEKTKYHYRSDDNQNKLVVYPFERIPVTTKTKKCPLKEFNIVYYDYIPKMAWLDELRVLLSDVVFTLGFSKMKYFFGFVGPYNGIYSYFDDMSVKLIRPVLISFVFVYKHVVDLVNLRSLKKRGQDPVFYKILYDQIRTPCFRKGLSLQRGIDEGSFMTSNRYPYCHLDAHRLFAKNSSDNSPQVGNYFVLLYENLVLDSNVTAEDSLKIIAGNVFSVVGRGNPVDTIVSTAWVDTSKTSVTIQLFFCMLHSTKMYSNRFRVKEIEPFLSVISSKEAGIRKVLFNDLKITDQKYIELQNSYRKGENILSSVPFQELESGLFF